MDFSGWLNYKGFQHCQMAKGSFMAVRQPCAMAQQRWWSAKREEGSSKEVEGGRGRGRGERKRENMTTFLVFVLGGGVSLCFGFHEIPLTLPLPLNFFF